jgi:hypothetical protein
MSASATGFARAITCSECVRCEDERTRAERAHIAAFVAFTRESETASPSEFEKLRSEASEARFNSEVARFELERHMLIHAKAD